MPGQTPIYADKSSPSPRFRNRQEELPFLQLIAYNPVGNPLQKLNAFQREFFFELLVRNAADSWVERQKEQIRRLRPVLHLQQAQSPVQGMQAKKEQEKKEELAKADFEKHRISKLERPPSKAELPTQAPTRAMRERQGLSLGTIEYSPALLVSKDAQESLSRVLDDYARGDEAKLQAAVSDFEGRLRAQNYSAHDLMSVMLLVIEDHIWEGSEGAPGSASHFGNRVQKVQQVPELLRTNAMNSAEVRLASVREMLRYYFEAHPKEYSQALAAALSITTDKEGDMIYLQERLAYELARIGSFALCQKILAAIKEKMKMDTQRCLLELGYKYDRKRKVLILGKRTCGSRKEARGIIGLLVALAKK